MTETPSHQRSCEHRDRQAMKPPLHRDYECPACHQWIEILPTSDEYFDCPWCKEPLRLDTDAEFVNGSWRDLSKLISMRPHMERMIAHKSKEDYVPAPDELRDAEINDADAGSAEGEE